MKLKRTGRVVAEKVQWMMTAKDRSKGLLIYKDAPKNLCAIFPLPLGGFFPMIHCIGMKFRIDVLFCNHKKEVLYKKEAVKPGSFVLPWKYLLGGASYLLEFSECSVSDIQLKDELIWESPHDS